jgi:hypothetical protein
LDAKSKELQDNVTALDKEIAKMYNDVKAAKTKSQQTYLKQRLVMLLKKRKMYQQQMDNYLGQQLAIGQIQFTKENIQNTIEMV